MYSSRMRTVRNSSRLLGGALSRLDVCSRGSAWSWGDAWSEGAAWSRGEGVCSQGVSAPGGCLLPGVSAPGEVPGPGGGLVCHYALRQTPTVNRMTDWCKNITFATSLRTVITVAKKYVYYSLNESLRRL